MTLSELILEEFDEKKDDYKCCCRICRATTGLTLVTGVNLTVWGMLLFWGLDLGVHEFFMSPAVLFVAINVCTLMGLMFGVSGLIFPDIVLRLVWLSLTVICGLFSLAASMGVSLWIISLVKLLFSRKKWNHLIEHSFDPEAVTYTLGILSTVLLVLYVGWQVWMLTVAGSAYRFLRDEEEFLVKMNKFREAEEVEERKRKFKPNSPFNGSCAASSEEKKMRKEQHNFPAEISESQVPLEVKAEES